MTTEIPKYIYDLPYHVRKKLCSVLDVNDKWEELGGIYMGFDNACLYQIGQAIKRNSSPTNELLQYWETHNHTIAELFVLLSRMQHYQAMTILKPYVSPKYHALIFEGEENLSRLLSPDNCGNFAALKPNDESTMLEKKNLDLEGNLNCDKELGVKDKVCLPKTENKISNNDQAAKLDVPKKPSSASSVSFTAESCTPIVPYKELEIATNNWNSSNILGRGGFGTVFVGTWKNTKVAIKRLEPHKSLANEANMELQRQQSYRELKYLNECRHNNILALFAYSMDGERYCLVYQYMQNGSLEDRLLCRHHTRPLTWSQRYNIAKGTALGLQFLHNRERPLIHGDIKSANILLDKTFEPQIGDFGLTQEGPLQQYTSIKVSRVHGTKAYLPEEFFRGKKFSVKVDVYSFGVVLFEIATGLRAFDDKRPQKLLRDFVHECDSNKFYELLDPKAEPDELRANPSFIYLGLACTKTSPKQRLDMLTVLNQIDAIIATHEITLRAQQNLPFMRQNALSPSNPYEMQLWHDVLKQQHRQSIPSPSPSTRSTSPGMNSNTPLRRSSSPAKLTHIHGTIVEEEVRPRLGNNGSLQPRTTVTSQETNASLQRRTGVTTLEQSVRPPPPSITIESSVSQNSSHPIPTNGSNASQRTSEPPSSSSTQASGSNDIEVKSLHSAICAIPSIVVNQLQSNNSNEQKDLLPITSVSTLYSSSSDEISSVVEPEIEFTPTPQVNVVKEECIKESENVARDDKSSENLPNISELLITEHSQVQP